MSALHHDYVHRVGPARDAIRIWHVLSELLGNGITAAVFALALYGWLY
jgi:hypothetical protein